MLTYIVNRKKIVGIFMIAFSLGSAVMWVILENVQISDSIEKAPAFHLQTVNNEAFFLEEFRGKVVVLNFWAAWCTFCRREMPILDVLAEQYSEDVVVIGVHRDATESLEEGLAFARELGVTYTLAQDRNDNVFRYFARGSNLMPLTVFIDKEGNIRERIIGTRSQERFKEILQNVLTYGE